MSDRLFLERLRNDEWHDEVQVTTVPRFKTSGLSGDEWRTSAHLVIRRKGVVVFERDYLTVADAAAHLPWLLRTYAEDGVDPDLTRAQCMQPGCAEKATVLLRKLADGCGRCGSVRQVEPDSILVKYRAFCDRHARRGDQNLDDSDGSYEVIAGAARPVADDESPAVFAGAVSIEDVPGFLRQVRGK